MKIGDRCFVHGYIDEIRKDTVIVRNDGGYFGTVLSEVTGELPSAQPEPLTLRVNNELTKEEYDKLMQDIKDAPIVLLPSAQPERIKGHWVEIASSNHTYKCSVCGRLLVNITDGKNNVAKNYPYCHCGADMRGEAE